MFSDAVIRNVVAVFGACCSPDFISMAEFTCVEGQEILFTGLGCDVAALKSCLNANHLDSSRQFTVDMKVSMYIKEHIPAPAKRLIKAILRRH